jgi:hypothetical protein
VAGQLVAQARQKGIELVGQRSAMSILSRGTHLAKHVRQLDAATAALNSRTT